MRHGSMPTIYVDRVRSAWMNELKMDVKEHFQTFLSWKYSKLIYELSC